MEKGIYSTWEEAEEAVFMGEVNPTRVRKVIVYYDE